VDSNALRLACDLKSNGYAVAFYFWLNFSVEILLKI